MLYTNKVNPPDRGQGPGLSQRGSAGGWWLDMPKLGVAVGSTIVPT